MTTWQANASFRLALRAQECGDYKRAREMYLRVLKDAPDHVPALHNLAVIELRSRRYKQSLQLIAKVRKTRDAKRQTKHKTWSQLIDKVRKHRDVKRQTKHEKGSQLSDTAPKTRDVWSEFDYSLGYNEALAHTLQAQQNGQIDAASAQKALANASELVQQLLCRLEYHDRPSVRDLVMQLRRRPYHHDRASNQAAVGAQPTKVPKPLTALLTRLNEHVGTSFRRLFAGRHRKSPNHDNELMMLEKIELAAITLLADIVLQANDTPAVWEEAARATLKDLDGGEPLDTPTEIAEYRRQKLHANLKRPLEATWASTAEYYVRAHPRTTARAYYNLACYRGRILQALNNHGQNEELCERLRKHALNDLDAALVDESLIKWAKSDPALEEVRNYDDWEKFLKSQQKAIGGEHPVYGDSPFQDQG